MSERIVVYIVDDDPSIQNLIQVTLRTAGVDSRCFSSAEEYFEYSQPVRPRCLLVDLELPGASGLELLERHFILKSACPVVIVTGKGSVQKAVTSMKLGAVDFLEKPFDRETLVKVVLAAVATERRRRDGEAAHQETQQRLGTLSPRERELLGAVMAGKSTKMIADELGISARTVDHHRANLMLKMGASNVADLVRRAVAAGFGEKVS